jgi:hypothetical protein
MNQLKKIGTAIAAICIIVMLFSILAIYFSQLPTDNKSPGTATINSTDPQDLAKQAADAYNQWLQAQQQQKSMNDYMNHWKNPNNPIYDFPLP